MNRSGRERVVVTHTLAEATALRNAVEHPGDPTTPKEAAALDRALAKIRSAQDRFLRGRRHRE